MKTSNIVIMASLSLLCLTGWGMRISTMSKNNTSFTQNLEAARVFRNKKLYQKSLASYQDAYAINSSEDLRQELLDCVVEAMRDGTTSYYDYIALLETAVKERPRNAGYWIKLIRAYRDSGDVKTAYNRLEKAQQQHIKGEEIDALWLELNYAYRITGGFADMVDTPYDVKTVRNEDKWAVLQPDDTSSVKGEYDYITPFGASYHAVYVYSEGSRLFGNGTTQAIIDPSISITTARACNDNRLPMPNERGEWHYLDCDTSQFLPDVYEDATSYMYGMAYVKRDGVWTMIDLNGNRISDVTFEDILLEENGEFSYNNIMVAKQNGQWGLYDMYGQLIAPVPGVKADHYRGSYIAFQDEEGLWGYMDTEGDVYIVPTYEEARSFSNGLAAVSNGVQWGYIETMARLVIPCQFSKAGYFNSFRKTQVKLEDSKTYAILSLVNP